MNDLKIKTGKTYRNATRDEILDAAAAFMVSETRGEPLTAPEASVLLLRGMLGGREHEEFVCVFLDNRHRVIDAESMFRGTIDGTSVYPREVVKRALELNAAAVICGHNHPSGVAEPSQADERITRRLKAALELVDIRLLDHIVVTNDSDVSFASRGLM